MPVPSALTCVIRRPSVRRYASVAFTLTLMALLPIAAAAQGTNAATTTVATAQGTDSTDVVAVVERLHALLGQGDSSAVLALFTPDVVILESGGFEDRAEFRAHHLPADIAFARAVRSDRTVRSARVAGDAAWVASTSITQGEFRGRAINSVGAELIVLRRTGGKWMIAAIHWSSRARRT